MSELILARLEGEQTDSHVIVCIRNEVSMYVHIFKPQVSPLRSVTKKLAIEIFHSHVTQDILCATLLINKKIYNANKIVLRTIKKELNPPIEL